MNALIFIGLIIAVVVQEKQKEKMAIKYKKIIEQLKQENMHLKEGNLNFTQRTDVGRDEEIENVRIQQLNQVQQQAVQTEKQVIQEHEQTEQIQHQSTYVEKKVQKEISSKATVQRKAIQKDVVKNNIILAVGSIFIVVAAISFLYTGWDILHNALKIGVLGILAIVFLMLSHLAKHKLNLPQTAKAFFYIAMGYIPIVLFSLSLLDLIGEYFSISGDGRFIYMFSASAIIMSLYYFVAYKFKDSKMQIAAHCMQTVLLVFGMLALKLSGKYLGICFVIHTLIFNLLIEKLNGFKRTNKIFGLVQSIIYTSLAVSTFMILWENPLYLLTMSIMIMALYYLLDKKFEKVLFKYVAQVFQTVIIGFVCRVLEINIELYPIIFLTHSLILNRFSKDCYAMILFEVYAFFSLFQIVTLWGSIKSLMTVILLILNTLMIKPKNESESSYKFIALKSFSYLLVLIMTFLKIEIVGVEYTLPWVIREIIWTVIILGTTLFYLQRPTIQIAKYGLVINFICLTLMSFVPASLSVIPANVFTLLGFVLALSTLKHIELKDKSSILNTVLIYTLFRFLIESSMVSHLIYLTICGFSLFLFETKKEFNVYRYIPLIAYWIKLYLNGTELFEESILVPVVLSVLVVIALEALSFIRIKNNEPYVIMSFFYLLLPLFRFVDNMNEYIILVIIAIWAFINLIITIDKLRTAVKVVLSSSIFMIYMMFVGDYIEGITVLLMHLGLIMYLHYITRKLLGKRVENYKTFEYIGLALIYLMAIGSITTPLEGILYLGMLTLFVIISYSQKLGPLFLTSVIAMLVKLLDLTQDFWLAIPWWLYILGIGAVMVTFSMRNEKKNQNNKAELKEKIKVAREYLDI